LVIAFLHHPLPLPSSIAFYSAEFRLFLIPFEPICQQSGIEWLQNEAFSSVFHAYLAETKRYILTEPWFHNLVHKTHQLGCCISAFESDFLKNDCSFVFAA
jgi:hypothetical protein